MGDHWGTPDWIMTLFSGWFDPCPAFSDTDSLEGVWYSDRIFVNPPYSNPRPWVEKAIRSSYAGATVVMLLKHDTSTQWYCKLKAAGARSLMIEGRLNYKNLANQDCETHNASFPSVLMVLGGE